MPDSKDETKLIESVEGHIDPADFEDRPDTDVEVLQIRQQMLENLELDAREIMKRHGVTKEEAYRRLQAKDLRKRKRGPRQTIGDRREVLKGVENERIEAQKRDLIAALAPLKDAKEGEPVRLKLQSYALYRDMEPWQKVSESVDYRGVKLDTEMLLSNLNDLIRIIWHKHAKEIRFVDLGPGIGEKLTKIILKLLNQIRLGKLQNLPGNNKLKHIEVDTVDVCGAMLHLTFVALLKELRSKIRKMQTTVLGDDHPWKEFVDFLNENGKSFTGNEDLATLKIEKSFYTFIANELTRHDGQPVESILKYALARYFGLKKRDAALLDFLDNDLQLPLEINPKLATFESLDGTRFHSTRETPTCFFHLGDEIGNDFPRDTFQNEYANLLGTATPFNKREHEKQVKNGNVDESNIDATYIVFSFQTGTLEHPNATQEEIDGDAKYIMPAYYNPDFNYFASHLFEKPELSTFSDPKTGRVFEDHTECYDVIPEYCEDPDHPGYYGSTHRLVFNRNVDIHITISYVEDDVIKNETLAFHVKEGQEVFLLPSYKPPVSQMADDCDKSNIKVVDVYQDINQTNAVFVVRAKTDFEIEYDRQRRLKLRQDEEELTDGDLLLDDGPEPANDNGGDVTSTRTYVRNELGQFARVPKRIHA